MFVDRGALFAEFLRAAKPRGLVEVRGLRRLLAREGVGREGRVLDIACGIGRHVVPLAQQGYRVVGCDFSPGFLAEARTWAHDLGVGPDRLRFYRTDYRRIDRTLRRAREAPFDAAISLFTSMGHYGEADDLATLRAVRRVMRPGGLFVIETANRDGILRHFNADGVMRAAAGLEVRERRRFDWERSTVVARWTFRRREGRRSRTVYREVVQVRLYSLHELKSLFERAGWEYVRAYGDLPSLAKFGPESRRLVVVARVPGAGPRGRRRKGRSSRATAVPGRRGAGRVRSGSGPA
jgi:SAM-dependent methyltransferase